MKPFRIAFVLDQVAGHVTTAANLRGVVDGDDEIDPVWCEVDYWIDSGAIERVHRAAPWLPSHPLGVLRGVVEQRRGLTEGPVEAIMTNTSVAQYHVRPLRATPTLCDFDSTPVQLDVMEGYEAEASGRFASASKFRLMRRLYRAVAINQAWSQWARQSVIDDYGINPDRVVVNPPGVDLTAWSPEGRTESADGGPARVLFVGGDFRRKGGTDLLDWYRGADPDRVRLDIVTREPVAELPGVAVYDDLRPNSEELKALYRSADVFVLPSRGECFGIATIEAMASGIPVVVTDVGGTADIVDHGDNGYIVPAGDSRALGSAILDILDDPIKAASMSRTSRLLAERRFDLQQNARRTLEMLKSLASDQRDRPPPR